MLWLVLSVYLCAQDAVVVTKMYTRPIIPVNRGITQVSFSGFSLLSQRFNQVMLTGVLQVVMSYSLISILQYPDQ